MTDKTVDEITNEIGELTKKIIGNINNFDSKKDKANATMLVLNEVIAGVELSKLEKAGTLTYLMEKRIKG